MRCRCRGSERASACAREKVGMRAGEQHSRMHERRSPVAVGRVHQSPSLQQRLGALNTACGDRVKERGVGGGAMREVRCYAHMEHQPHEAVVVAPSGVCVGMMRQGSTRHMHTGRGEESGACGMWWVGCVQDGMGCACDGGPAHSQCRQLAPSSSTAAARSIIGSSSSSKPCLDMDVGRRARVTSRGASSLRA